MKDSLSGRITDENDSADGFDQDAKSTARTPLPAVTPIPTNDDLEAAEEISESSDNENEDSYFADDEAVLTGDDTLLQQGKASALVQQGENVVMWEITGLYKEGSNAVKNRWSLRNDPPIFKVEGSDGDFAAFVITKELAGTLAKVFTDVQKAYLGVDPSVVNKPFSQASLQEKRAAFIEWVKEHKVKSGLLGVFLIVAFLTPFLH